MQSSSRTDQSHESLPGSSVLRRKGETPPPTSCGDYCTHRLPCSPSTTEKTEVQRSEQPRVTQPGHLSFCEPMIPLYVAYSYWAPSLGNHSTLCLHFCRVRPPKSHVPRTQKAPKNGKLPLHLSRLRCTTRPPRQGASQAPKADKEPGISSVALSCWEKLASCYLQFCRRTVLSQIPQRILSYQVKHLRTFSAIDY